MIGVYKCLITITDESVSAQAYGREEAVGELIPAMLAAFLESDKSFVRDRDARLRGLK